MAGMIRLFLRNESGENDACKNIRISHVNNPPQGAWPFELCVESDFLERQIEPVRIVNQT